MTTVTEKELKDILNKEFEKVNQQFEKVNQQFEKVNQSLSDLKVGQVRLEERLTGEIKTLDAKIDGISQRLNFQENINRTVLGGVTLALLIGLVKFLSFFPNP
jgi:uncharacterized protein Yka (UPF0111/DUF47 family)